MNKSKKWIRSVCAVVGFGLSCATADASTYTVTSTADNATICTTACTLRGAITSANAHGGANTIAFGMSGAQTITPASALPSINTPTIIDGTTEGGYSGTPLIQLSGSSAGSGSNGFLLTSGAAGSIIRGFVINGFGQHALYFSGVSNVTVTANYIGLNTAGTAAVPILNSGIFMDNTSTNNTIGGTTASLRNVISGNNNSGIEINGTNNFVQGNYLGLNAAGTSAVPNTIDGVFLATTSSGNKIGGTTAGMGNVISGNGQSGIEAFGPSNTIQGNTIGLNAAGNAAIHNNDDGIYLDAANNVVGGTVAGSPNVLSGNSSNGIEINANTNNVQGNIIGLNSGGTSAIGNGGDGIYIGGGTGNIIGGTTAAAINVLSGNSNGGIEIASNSNTVTGNYIGTNAAGTSAIPNHNLGVELSGKNNTIGGTATGAGNVISGNQTSGIGIDSGSTGNTIQGNIIGLNATGSAGLGNSNNGIYINGGNSNTIGGTVAGARNIISGNNQQGIEIDSINNTIQGNYIGVNPAGTSSIGNGYNGIHINGFTGNTIGGAVSGAGNVISGNNGIGIQLSGSSSSNTIQGNTIGLNAAGSAGLSNGAEGVVLQSGSNSNVIGGTTAITRNIISGNNHQGIEIDSNNNTIQGNYIGTDVTGASAFSNGYNGIYLNSASNNTIGGSTSGTGNLISGNSQSAVSIGNSSNSNIIQGNIFGLNAAGTAALANGGPGIQLSGTSNTIGGVGALLRNIISGNGQQGIYINGGSSNTILGNYIGLNSAGTSAVFNGWSAIEMVSSSNTNTIGGAVAGAGNVMVAASGQAGILVNGCTGTIIQGNYLGTNAAGNSALGIGDLGIYIYNGSNNTTVGGNSAAAGNIIAATGSDGLKIAATGTTVQGNYIGTNSAGISGLGNGRQGVYFDSPSSGNLIGGTGAGQGNTISFNTMNGIAMAYNNITGNQFFGNSIYSNGQLGIDLGNDGVTTNDVGDGDSGGANDFQNFPVLTSVTGGSSTTVVGTLNSNASRNYRLEFFSSAAVDPSGYGEGQTYLGTVQVTTDASGNASFNTTLSTATSSGQWISATATDLTATETSEFAQSRQIVSPMDHYQIVHNSSCVTCQAESVTINPHTSSGAAVTLNNSTTITLSAAYVSGAGSSGHGDWALVSGGGTLNNGTADDGVATYTFAAGGESSVTLSYKNTWAQTVQLHVTDSVYTDLTGTPESNASMNFSGSAFLFTNGSSAITIGTQIAGKPSSVNPGAQSIFVQAIRTDTNTGACVGVFASGTTVNVNMASQCNNPTSCNSGQSVGITNNSVTTAIATNSNSSVSSYTSVPLLFGANSQAAISLNYSDVGQISVYASYVLPLGTGSASSNTMTGNTNAFIVRPFGYAVYGVKCSVAGPGTCAPALASPGLNPAAANATGPAFIQAGRNFALTVKAVGWQASQDTNNDGVPDAGVDLSGNAATPNYGRETPAQGVTLTSTLVAPAGGDVGVFSGSIPYFFGGSGTSSTFQWSEAGIITLTPSLANYLSSGAAVTGATSANIGRFIPDHFDTAVTPGIVCPGGMTCTPASGFTYSGQAFGVQLVARNLAGAAVLNYDNTLGYAKAVTLSAWDAATGTVANPGPAAHASGGVLTNGAVAATAFSSGSASLTTPTYGFTAQKTAPTLILARAVDTDSISSLRVVAASSVEGQTQVQSGQIKIVNAYGSPLVGLPLTVWLQYWNGSNWVFSTQDQTTSFNSAIAPTGNVVASNPQQNLTGVSTQSSGAVRFMNKNGLSGFALAAPGTGKNGSMDLTINSPAYLSSTGGRATFGVYAGSPGIVYLREVY